jgi:hypothetical protein
VNVLHSLPVLPHIHFPFTHLPFPLHILPFVPLHVFGTQVPKSLFELIEQNSLLLHTCPVNLESIEQQRVLSLNGQIEFEVSSSGVSVYVQVGYVKFKFEKLLPFFCVNFLLQSVSLHVLVAAVNSPVRWNLYVSPFGFLISLFWNIKLMFSLYLLSSNIPKVSI